MAKTSKSPLKAALKKHAGDDLKPRADFTNLPAGITDGVAKLTAATLGEYKAGTQYAGEKFIRLAGTVVEPTKHTAMPKVFADGQVKVASTKEMTIKGLQTSQMLPLCDTKTQAGKVTSCDENVERALNELRLLGIDTNDIEDEESLESVLEALVEAEVYFKFKTSGSNPTAQFPEERVWENWYGILEDYEQDDSDDGVEDDTEDEEDDDSEEPESDSEDEEDESDDSDEEESEDASDDDLDDLVAKAEKEDGDAQTKLAELASEAGVSDSDVDEADDWQAVADLIRGASGESDDDSEESEEEDGDWTPEKGETYLYKAKGKRKASLYEVTAVFAGKQTVNLKNADTGATVRGVAWDQLQDAE